MKDKNVPMLKVPKEVAGCYRRFGMFPDNKVHGVNMGPTWGQQDPGGSHLGHANLAIWVSLSALSIESSGILYLLFDLLFALTRGSDLESNRDKSLSPWGRNKSGYHLNMV